MVCSATDIGFVCSGTGSDHLQGFVEDVVVPVALLSPRIRCNEQVQGIELPRTVAESGVLRELLVEVGPSGFESLGGLQRARNEFSTVPLCGLLGALDELPRRNFPEIGAHMLIHLVQGVLEVRLTWHGYSSLLKKSLSHYFIVIEKVAALIYSFFIL